MKNAAIKIIATKVAKPLANAYWRWRYRLAVRRVRESGQADNLDNGNDQTKVD